VAAIESDRQFAPQAVNRTSSCQAVMTTEQRDSTTYRQEDAIDKLLSFGIANTQDVSFVTSLKGTGKKRSKDAKSY
jgi:hypothetical protein